VVAAFIKGARQRGVRCIEGVKVLDIHRENGRVRGVSTDQGDIQAEYVVNAAGLWSRDLGRLAGVNVPLHACEHYYAHTEKLDDLPADLPVMRDHDKCAYYREDAGSLLVGAFEPNARPLPMAEIPEDFCFDELPGHMEEQLMPVLEDAMIRVPMLQNVGWRSFFCGPESFTPDDQFHVGEAPELKNFFVACGLNSVGLQMSGGLGKACAEWMHLGHPPLDLWGNDIRRTYAFQGTQRYLEERVSETLGLLYANHYPYRQYESARNVRHSPIHERLVQQNACFGESAGWERPNWFAPDGVEPRYEYSFGRQNWFEYSAAEHRAAREGLAVFDQSSFSKYLIQGKDACNVLQRICSADVDVAAGRIVYTHWLNERGGIEADLTVTRFAEDRYMVVSGAAVTNRDLDWLARNIPGDAHCTCTDVTAAWAVLGVMGPGSRALLEEVTSSDLSNAAFPFGTAQRAEIGCAVATAIRVSYVGELGWELYVPSDQSRHAYDVLREAGAGHGLVPAGMHALDSCRIEKKFLHFGHDIADEDTPVEAGMRFVCNFDKPIHFIGRDAISAQLDAGGPLKKRMVQFLLEDPEAMLYHHEPIIRDGATVGYLTSGNYGHSLGGSVGLGYARCEDGVDRDYIDAGKWEIDVGGVRIPAKASLRALYDPKGERTKA
jgi:4-methylaminobutanoate oxidase (formaldehyde-forming)